jgi:hypothetical protein
MQSARTICAAFLVSVLGLCGCRAIDMTADVAGKVLGTAGDVAGHAVGAAGAAVCLEPREVIEHTAGAAKDAVSGVGAVTRAATGGVGRILD